MYASASRISITQQVIIDDEVIAFIVYDMDRGADSRGGPSVELTGFQKYAGNKEVDSSPPVVSTSSFYPSDSDDQRPRYDSRPPMKPIVMDTVPQGIPPTSPYRSSYRRMGPTLV